MMIKKAYNWIKDKILRTGKWIKAKIRWILITTGIIGVALAIGMGSPEIPSIIAEGQSIEFLYTDDNSNEDFIIRTDKEIYTPLWPWNGFDIYVMVENKSGKNQRISLQSFFSKDFSIEEIAVLNPTEKTTIEYSICSEGAMIITDMGSFCSAFETIEKEVLGKWNSITVDNFSKEDYDNLILEKNIPIKDKGEKKAKYKISTDFSEGQISYYKITLKSNQRFRSEEFDLEIIGDKGGYGLLDPTVLTETFDSYNDGDLNGQGSWVTANEDTDTFKIQGTVTYGSSAKAVSTPVNDAAVAYKTGTGQADGTQAGYIRASSTSCDIGFDMAEGANILLYMRFYTTGQIQWYSGSPLAWTNIQAYSANTWYKIEIEWRSSDHYWRVTIDDGTPTDWAPGVGTWTTIDRVYLITGTTTEVAYIDELQEAFDAAVRRIIITE